MSAFDEEHHTVDQHPYLFDGFDDVQREYSAQARPLNVLGFPVDGHQYSIGQFDERVEDPRPSYEAPHARGGMMMQYLNPPLPAQTNEWSLGRMQAMQGSAVQSLALLQQAQIAMPVTLPTSTNDLMDHWQFAPHPAMLAATSSPSTFTPPTPTPPADAAPHRPATPPGSKRMANGHFRTIHYNNELNSAVPVTARLPQCAVGAIELLIFFPNHTQWPEVIMRLLGNGLTIESIAEAQLHGRGNGLDESCRRRRAALRQQKLVAGRVTHGVDDWTERRDGGVFAVTNYDCSNYAPRERDVPALFDAKLVDVASGVVHWPAGEDCGIVTQAIRYAVRHSRDDLTTADVLRLAQEQGFQMPAEAAGSQWDQLGHKRMMDTIEAAGTYA